MRTSNELTLEMILAEFLQLESQDDSKPIHPAHNVLTRTVRAREISSIKRGTPISNEKKKPVRTRPRGDYYELSEPVPESSSYVQ